MPELPEVHTTAMGLNGVLPGLIVRDFWSDCPKQIKGATVHAFRNKVQGARIKEIHRMAKNILIELSNGLTIRIHMKMTGQLLFDRPNVKYIHQRFYLSKKHELSFADLRKFGRIELIETGKIHEHGSLKLLGPEPLDASLTAVKVETVLMKRKNALIKIALMDQNTISGIGNIYADEILWEAGILPTRKIKDLDKKDFARILKSARRVLLKSIKLGGDSMSDYRNIYNEKGLFQNFHKAYHQAGRACQKRGCGGIIEKIKLGGRTAHFCPKHQQ